MNQAELAELEQSFEHVIVELNDGNQLLMFKCLKCDYVCRSNSHTKIAHWKRCPSKFFFKYVSQNECTGGIMLACLKCHLRLLASSLYDMKTHFESCPLKFSPNPSLNISNSVNSTNVSQSIGFGSTNQLLPQAKSNSVTCIYETMVSAIELDAQRKISMRKTGICWVPGFKLKYIHSPIGPQANAECQICRLLEQKPTIQALQLHRIKCKYLYNVQVNAHLQPVQPVITQTRTMLPYTLSTMQPTMKPHTVTSQPQQLYPTIPNVSTLITTSNPQTQPEQKQKLCFVCNTSSSKTFVSLFGTKTKFRGTQIYDYIWKIQGNNTSVRNESVNGSNSHLNYVCAECLEMINELDLTCKTFADLQKKLREKLCRTEEFYKQLQKDSETQKVLEIPISEHSVRNVADYVDLNSPPSTKESTDERQPDKEIDGNGDIEDEYEKVHYLVELSDDEAEVETIELDSD